MRNFRSEVRRKGVCIFSPPIAITVASAHLSLLESKLAAMDRRFACIEEKLKIVTEENVVLKNKLNRVEEENVDLKNKLEHLEADNVDLRSAVKTFKKSFDVRHRFSLVLCGALNYFT